MLQVHMFALAIPNRIDRSHDFLRQQTDNVR